MANCFEKLLSSLLEHGDVLIGEIVVKSDLSLRHHADSSLLEKELQRYTHPEEARQIARYESEGGFRPLKSAPSLKRGWLLQLKTLEKVMEALDFFYPAALGLYQAWREGVLSITPLRETLNRQTGMYRITQLLNDAQAEALVVKMCSSDQGCLRKVLWNIAPDQEIQGLPQEKKSASAPPQEIPLLCREACNLLVAEARGVVKSAPK